MSADVRTGFAGSTEEAMQGDAAAAFVVGSDADGPLVAELMGTASITDEHIERWRAPGELRTWCGTSASARSPASRSRSRLGTWHSSRQVSPPATSRSPRLPRRCSEWRGSVGGKLDGVQVIDDLSSTVGIAGAAQPGLLLAALLEQAEAGQILALVSVADGADVLLFRATGAISRYRPSRAIATQLAAGGPVSYGKFLAWNGVLPVEPPRRAEPQRVSATAAARNADWKFAFVGSKERDTGVVHVPPSRVSCDGEHTDEMEPAPLADKQGTIATFTVDRLAYSPARRSCSRSSTSTVAGGSRSSSPTWTRAKWRSACGWR